MQVIDARTVELTARELKVRVKFEALLEAGFSISVAAREALRKELSWVEKNFVEYLSDGTLTLLYGDLHVARSHPAKD